MRWPFRRSSSRESDVRRTLRISTIEGCFTVVFMNWTAGSALTGYLLHYAAGPTALALAASLPALVQIINPFAVWFTNRLQSRLPFIVWSTLLGRSLWLLPVLLPFLHLLPQHAVYFLVAVVGLASLITSPANPPWISMMADVVPAPLRGRYFGQRNSIIGVVSQTISLTGGMLLDRLPEPYGFQVVIGIAVLFAWTGIYFYTRQYDPPVKPDRTEFGRSLLIPLLDPVFRRFLMFSSFWSFSVMVGSPFVIPYFLTHLEMTYTQVQIWAALGSLFMLMTAPMWGRIADQSGNKSVLAITTVLAGTVYPFCWLFAQKGHLALIWFSGFVNAMSWGGITVAMTNLQIRITPPQLRATYMATAGSINGICAFLGGLVSGPVLHALSPYETEFMGFHWTGYHWLFLLTGLMRSCAWMFLHGVTEPEAWRTRDLLRSLRERSTDYLGRLWPSRSD